MPLSSKKNNFKIKSTIVNRQRIDVTFKRAINYKIGNRYLQAKYPIWVHDRQSLSKSNYIDALLIHLGYDEPVYDEPENSPTPVEEE